MADYLAQAIKEFEDPFGIDNNSVVITNMALLSIAQDLHVLAEKAADQPQDAPTDTEPVSAKDSKREPRSILLQDCSVYADSMEVSRYGSNAVSFRSSDGENRARIHVALSDIPMLILRLTAFVEYSRA